MVRRPCLGKVASVVDVIILHPHSIISFIHLFIFLGGGGAFMSTTKRYPPTMRFLSSVKIDPK
eukprot:COSAG06_NODE_16988_length_968_cov_1.972382_1_plen_63_part_00